MALAMLPTLATQRLILRPRTETHIPALMSMHADPQVMRFIGDGTPADPVRTGGGLTIRLRGERAGRLRDGPADELGYWSVFEKSAPDRFLGWTCLIPLPGHAPEIELGYRFRADAWGHGYATEAAAACLAHGFASVGLAQIVAVAKAENAASLRVLAKLGFRAAGTRLAYGETLEFFQCVAAGPGDRPAGELLP